MFDIVIYHAKCLDGFTAAWVASGLSILGIWFNAKKNNWCWPIWIVSNVLWVYIAYERRSGAELTLWITFIVSNVYGWWEWTRRTK